MDRRRRAFSLIEAVVVLGLIVSATAAAIYWSASSARPEQDATAKAALATVYQAQVTALVNGDPLLDASALSASQPTQSYTTGPSSDPSTVSVRVDGTAVLMAVSTAGGDCWMLRFEASPSPVSPREVWFLDEAAEACSSETLETITVPLDGSGAASDEPVLL